MPREPRSQRPSDDLCKTPCTPGQHLVGRDELVAVGLTASRGRCFSCWQRLWQAPIAIAFQAASAQPRPYFIHVFTLFVRLRHEDRLSSARELAALCAGHCRTCTRSLWRFSMARLRAVLPSSAFAWTFAPFRNNKSTVLLQPCCQPSRSRFVRHANCKYTNDDRQFKA